MGEGKNESAGDAGSASLDARSVQCASDQTLRFKKQPAVATVCVSNVGSCFRSAGSAINHIAQVTVVCDMILQPMILRLRPCLNAKLVTTGQVQTHMTLSTIKSKKKTCF